VARAAPSTGNLQFRLLGPLEVWRDGRPVRLGGDRQRGLLALLLLQANAVVAAETLIDDLYRGDPSGTAGNALQAAVYRLRRALENGAAGVSPVLETKAPGYVLHADREQLDLGVFEALAADGRAALAEGDAARAGVLLREALAVWRGPPLADLALLDCLQQDVRRLEALRLETLMDRIDADLAIGDAAGVVPELEALVAVNPLQERLRGQLMLALYRAGRQADALRAYRDTRELLRDELGLEPSRALQQLERAILQHDAAIEPPVAAAGDDVVCPFKGLASYETDDADFFCGREQIVADLVARLAADSLVGIVGASGVGKSSILRAGVLPRLQAGVLPGSDSRRIVIVRPGGTTLAGLRRLVEDDSGERVVLAVDQLEELFTAVADEQEQAAILDSLARLVGDPSRRALVVVALRADFYGRCASSPSFAALLSASHVLVGPMAREELVRAIDVPATRAGLQDERELVDALVADVLGEPGALPLLSTTLLELWRRRDGRLLRLGAYRALGGVRGAVARLAEGVYERLDPDEQETVRGIMLRLTVGEGDAAARRRVPLAELPTAEAPVLERLVEARLLTVDDGAVEVAHEALLREWPRLQQWLDEDRDARRLRAHLTAAAGDWEQRGRDPADLYRGARLSAALDWLEAHDRELNEQEQAFMSASRDERERELLQQRRRARRLLALAIGVAVLLALAVAAGAIALDQRGRARHEATVALARQLGATAVSEPRIDRAMLLARQAVALNGSPQTQGSLLTTLLRSPAATGTFTGPVDSRPQRLAVSPSGGTVAVSDNNAIVRFYDPVRRRVRHLVHDLAFGDAVVYSRDGALVFASGGSDSPRIEVRHAGSLQLVRGLSYDRRWLTHPTGSSPPLVATHDARRLFLAYPIRNPDGSDGPAYIDRWDVPSGRLLSTTAVGADGTADVRLVDGDRKLVVVGARSVTMIDARTMRRIRSVRLPAPPPGVAERISAASPDGTTVVVETGPGVLSFVDLATGRVLPGLGSAAAVISSAAFSPDGRTLVTGAEDGAVIVWATATRAPVQRLNGHGGRVLGIAFSADGRTLYTCSLDGAIFEWDLGAGRRFGRAFTTSAVGREPPLSDDVYAHPPPLAVSPDGLRFAVRVGSAEVALYDTRTGRAGERWSPPLGREVTGLAWSSGGTLAVTGDSGAVQLWRADGSPRLIRRLRALRSVNGQPEVVTSVAFSGDGSLVAAGDVNHTPRSVRYRLGTVAVWDASSGRLLWQHRSRSGTVNAVAFGPDGKLLAAGYEDGTVVLYDARTGRLARALHLEGGGGFLFETLAFSPDGLLATGTWAGIVQLWDVATGREVGRPTLVAAAPVASISFDPTGETFATSGGSDGLAKLWRTSSLQQFGSTFPGEPGTWGTARYTADGSRLVVVYDDGAGYVWPTSPAAWERHACAVAGRSFTREEWRRYVGGRRYEATCG
jgi:WD40 repeat protein/DNA-binding SARP family transcriptional activator